MENRLIDRGIRIQRSSRSRHGIRSARRGARGPGARDLRGVFAFAVLALALAAAPPVAAAPAEADAAAAKAGVVNVNTAGVGELALLPRIGPAVAQRIVEHREANGPFAQPTELLLVRGIGDRTFALLEPYVVVEGETTLREKVRAGSIGLR